MSRRNHVRKGAAARQRRQDGAAVRRGWQYKSSRALRRLSLPVGGW